MLAYDSVGFLEEFIGRFSSEGPGVQGQRFVLFVEEVGEGGC